MMQSDHFDDHRASTEIPRLVLGALRWILGFFAFLTIATIVAFVVVEVRKHFFGVKSPNLQVAAIHHPQDIVSLIRDGHDVNALIGGQTPLGHAVTFRKVESVRLLLANGADPNVQGDDGKTPLASPFISSYVDPTNRQVIDLLLDAGADPNVHGVFGATPLHQAIQKIDFELARRLLALGADPNAVDDVIQRSPTHVAAEKADAGLFRELLAAGADVNLPNRYGTTPLMVAVQNANEPVVEVILEAGVDVSVPDWSDTYIESKVQAPRIREYLRQNRPTEPAQQR